MDGREDFLDLADPHLSLELAPLHEIRDEINQHFGANLTTKSIAWAILGNKKLLDKLLGRKPCSIIVRRRGELWGIDITELRLLIVFRVYVLGVVDYFASRLIALRPPKAATAKEVIRVLDEAFERCGKPSRIISDRGRVFTGDPSLGL